MRLKTTVPLQPYGTFHPSSLLANTDKTGSAGELAVLLPATGVLKLLVLIFFKRAFV